VGGERRGTLEIKLSNERSLKKKKRSGRCKGEEGRRADCVAEQKNQEMMKKRFTKNAPKGEEG